MRRKLTQRTSSKMINSSLAMRTMTKLMTTMKQMKMVRMTSLTKIRKMVTQKRIR